MGSGMLPDRTYYKGATHRLVRIGQPMGLAVDHLGMADRQSDQPVMLDDHVVRYAPILELEQIFALRLLDNLDSRLTQRFGALGRRVGRDIRERHIDDAPAIKQAAGGDPEPTPIEPVALQHDVDTLALELDHVRLDPARPQGRHHYFKNCKTLTTSIEASPPPITIPPGDRSKRGPS